MKRILLVEDEVIVALDMQQRLEALSYEIVGHATSGEDAVSLALTEIPDVILMDIKLRGKLDGIDTAAQIRQKKKNPSHFLNRFFK